MLKLKNLVFLGAPGSGKGTISNLLMAKYPLAHISTGDILRAEVAAGSETGKQAGALMKAGKLVPDELVAAMVSRRLTEPDCEAGFILDGFPRTIPQAKLLDEALTKLGKKLDRVIFINVSEELILQRLTARLSCRGCGAIYNKLFMPPKVAGKCDKCGGELYQRADDSLETAQSRLKVFTEQTAPLIDFYGKRGDLFTVAGTESADILKAILAELE